MQPGWRHNDDGENSRDDGSDDGDWTDIRLSGTNGLLSVLAALFFWGDAVHARGTPTTAWLEALGDVAYVIERLT